MQQLATLKPYLLQLSTLTAVWLLLMLAARRTQVNAWCMKRPRIAGILKLLRAVGFDPWLAIQGLTLLLKGRLPADLLKALAGVTIVLALTGCGASTQLVAATTTSGHTYPYCLEVTYPVLSLQADVVFCGTIESVQNEQVTMQQLYPQAKLAIIKGLPVEQVRR